MSHVAPLVRATMANAVANDFCQKAQALGREVRRGMIEPDNPEYSIGKKCELLPISRSSFYYQPKGESRCEI